MKILMGMLVSFFGFEIYENVIFWVAKSWRHFLGLKKLMSLFGFIENLCHFLVY